MSRVIKRVMISSEERLARMRKYSKETLAANKKKADEQHKINEQEAKEKIRELLKMIEDNIDMFNDHGLKFINKKEVKKYISIWRWYISHGYFNEKHPKPEGLCSNPSLAWLYAQLKGLTVPLSRDIGRCIEPVVSSSLMMEQSAHRIRNILTGIYRYISPEDMKANAEAVYKRKVTDKLDAKKRAEYEQARRDKKRLKPPTEAEYEKAGKEFLKLREKQRKESLERREAAKRSTLERYDADTRRLKRGN